MKKMRIHRNIFQIKRTRKKSLKKTKETEINTLPRRVQSTSN